MQSKPPQAALDDTRLAALAAAQHGVVAVGQLHGLGYSRHAVAHRAAKGRLHRIHRGVYAVGHTKLTIRGRWMAAVLACGPGAALSHSDAATLHDLRRVGSGAIHVTAPSRHHLPGIRCHFTRRALETTLVDAIPVTTVERTLLDEAAELSRQRLSDLLERAQQQDKLNLRLLESVLAASDGHRGRAPLRAAVTRLTDEPPWTQSELERRFRALTEAHDLPIPLTNQYVEGELVDAYWPQQALVVEIDGWKSHKTNRSFEADRARDAKLVTAGFRAVRFTYRRIRDEPREVAAQLRRMLSGDGGPVPPLAKSGR